MTVQTLPADHYQLLVEAGPTLMWRATPDAKRDYFNATWLGFTGRTLERERGDGWTEGVHTDDLQRCLDLHRTSFAQGRPFELEYRLRRHDGVHRWIVDRGVPFHVDGELAGFIGSCTDVSELREADQAKATFISTLVRELRKPLMPLMLCAKKIQLLAPAGTPDQLVVAQRIDRQVGRLSALFDRASRALGITRGSTHEPRFDDVELGPLVGVAIDEHRRRARARGIETQILNNGTWGSPRPVRAEASELTQALTILLDNALEYSPDRGTITVEIVFEPTTVRVVIDDDGIGIPPAELPRVGTPYFRASNVASSSDHAGMGLGLAVARDIVEAHGGTLALSPCSPKGTRAMLMLPLSAEC